MQVRGYASVSCTVGVDVGDALPGLNNIAGADLSDHVTVYGLPSALFV